VPRPRRIESVFLNIPYDEAFEKLYLAYIVGLTQLGLRINAALAVPNQGRLGTIINLIDQSDFSIHDLSRIEAGREAIVSRRSTIQHACRVGSRSLPFAYYEG
jgi:hypothetical protein